jgi:CMP-N-acetylneuraminic acid synthetase
VVLLQPTSPLRTAEDIKAAIGLFLKNKTEFLVSVCRSCHPIHTYFNVGRRYLRPILGWRYFLKSETSGPLEAYVPNGAIYISTPQNLKKYKTFFSPKTLPYIMPPERSIDIDEETDLKLAELLLNPVRKRRG